MRYESYEAVVNSQGNDHPEYHMETTGTPTSAVCTCWIPSNEGNTFRVLLRGASQQSLELRLLADGHLLEESIADHCTSIVLSHYKTFGKQSPFRFGRDWIPTEEFDEDEMDMTDPSKWIARGTITLQVYHVLVVDSPGTWLDANDYVKLNKTALQTVTLGHTRSATPEELVEYRYTKQWGETPFLTFHFKHRPQSWLEKYQIMPPPLLPDFGNLSLNRPATPPIVQGISGMSLQDNNTSGY